ncbi:uncharacterized protein CEXT_295961 [Caerostris extrusa]|uniref:Uncharacterized protein n=1 Tax=Caerostris extrusa TaxID=172846 RepID=A0AAV4UU77_CAEEX|nr:uncharacterized protein CEXT_295961 [Caerostris extrusa]
MKPLKQNDNGLNKTSASSRRFFQRVLMLFLARRNLNDETENVVRQLSYILNPFWTAFVRYSCEQPGLGLEENVKELLARRKSLDYVRQLVEDMDNQLNRLHKRSCFLRLPGMDCDYGGIPGSNKDQSFWVGDDSPGKKRSYQYSCDFKVGNPEGCLGKLVDGDKKDNSHWGDPDGPGKK